MIKQCYSRPWCYYIPYKFSKHIDNGGYNYYKRDKVIQSNPASMISTSCLLRRCNRIALSIDLCRLYALSELCFRLDCVTTDVYGNIEICCITKSGCPDWLIFCQLACCCMPTVTFWKVEVAQKENWHSFGLLFTKAIFLHFFLKSNFKAWFVVGILKVQKLLGLATIFSTFKSGLM